MKPNINYPIIILDSSIEHNTMLNINGVDGFKGKLFKYIYFVPRQIKENVQFLAWRNKIVSSSYRLHFLVIFK